jgi:hypothetical protein
VPHRKTALEAVGRIERTVDDLRLSIVTERQAAGVGSSSDQVRDSTARKMIEWRQAQGLVVADGAGDGAAAGASAGGAAGDEQAHATCLGDAWRQAPGARALLRVVHPPRAGSTAVPSGVLVACPALAGPHHRRGHSTPRPERPLGGLHGCPHHTVQCPADTTATRVRRGSRLARLARQWARVPQVARLMGTPPVSERALLAWTALNSQLSRGALRRPVHEH